MRNATPTWTVTQATSAPNHFGSICNFGLNCDTSVPKGDRSLLDYFQVVIGPDGMADIIFADNHDVHLASSDCWPSCSPYVTFVHQSAGTSAFAPTATQHGHVAPGAGGAAQPEGTVGTAPVVSLVARR